MRDPVVHIFTKFDVVSVLVLAILIGLQWHFIVILIYISLMTYNMEHRFICLFLICLKSVCSYLEPIC